ncbi:unnamed protein product [Mortierella alpina]
MTHIYINHRGDKGRAHLILLEHLKKYTDPANTVYYVDGYPALEKQATHRVRDEKRVKALTTAETAIKTIEERVSQARPPTKELCKKAEKGLRGGFKWSILDRRNFVAFLQGQQLDARFCETEADIAIAADCQPVDIVLSQDSDFFAYESVKTLWRPVGKKDDIEVLEYNKAALGIATNYKILKNLPDGDVPSLVLIYHESPLVIWRDQSSVDFTVSILVLTTMTKEIAAAEAATSDPPSTAPLIEQAALPESFEELYQQYKSIKDQYEAVKVQRRVTSRSQSVCSVGHVQATARSSAWF